MGEFAWLADQALRCVARAWPVTVLLLGLLLASIFSAWAVLRMDRRWLLQLLPATMTVAMLGLGASFPCPDGARCAFLRVPRYEWAGVALHALFGVQLLGSAWVIWYHRQAWPFAVAMQLLVCWYSVWAYMVAAIMIAGDWF